MFESVAADLIRLEEACKAKGYGVKGAKISLRRYSKTGPLTPYYVIRIDPPAEWTDYVDGTYRGEPRRWPQYHKEVSIYGGLTGALAQLAKLPDRTV